MSTPLHRPSVLAFGTQNCSTTAALLLIAQFDQRDLLQGNSRDIDGSLHKLDLELSDKLERTGWKGDV